MKSFRTKRVNELLKREIGELINNSLLGATDFFYTVTEVRTTKDLKHADVWISVLGSPEKRGEAIRVLKENSWRVKKELAKRVYLKRLPEVEFKLDDTLDKAERIEKILKDINTSKTQTVDSDD